MTNEQIAQHLETLADLLEIQGANSFRTNAYRNGARRIRQLSEPIESLVARGVALTTLDGIGKSVAEKCYELIERGKLKQIEELLQVIPPSVLDLLQVPRLGPKKVAALFHQLHITNLEELRAACQAGRVRELAGFGAKTQQSILEGIAIASAANQRILWAQADDLVQELRHHFADCRAIRHLDFAGSYRRGRETVGDLDLLVDATDADTVMDHFAKFRPSATLSGRGPTKMSIRLDNGFAIDLRVVPPESFGSALQYFTGSKEHNVVMRQRAKDRGWKLNEWGLFVDDDAETRLEGASEQGIYKRLGLPFIPPELRENRQEFAWAEAGNLPVLIELADIRGDLHMHTTATDGAASIEEMAAAAKAHGLSYIAITDHSQRVAMARGLDPARLLAQWAEIDAINRRLGNSFQVLKGIECDILENGQMDLPDDVLAQADWVVASVHYGQTQPREQITARIIGAIAHPHVSMIAHPTGRLINRREPYDVDISAVMDAAAHHGKLLELNASPKRLDLNDIHLAAAAQRGIPIVINTDAHSIDGLEAMRYGIVQARRAGLTKRQVANCLPWPELKKLMGKKR